MNANRSLELARRSPALLALFFLGFSPARAQIRPLNTDTPAYIEVERTDVSGYEGSSITIHLYRMGEFRWTTRVDYLLVGETADEGSDFKAAGGTVVFQPGEGVKSLEVELLADNEIETSEKFAIKFSGQNEQTVIVQDTIRVTVDDPPGGISNPPALHITRAEDGKAVLSWNGAPEAVLERTADPAKLDWETVPCVVEREEGTNRVVENCAGLSYMYRLRVP